MYVGFSIIRTYIYLPVIEYVWSLSKMSQFVNDIELLRFVHQSVSDCYVKLESS